MRYEPLTEDEMIRLTRDLADEELTPGPWRWLTMGGDQPFMLVARGGWAWSRGPLQEQAIIDAVRSAGGMRIEARDASGRRFADPYALDGAPTAIDAAAARCAGKMQRP